MEPIPDHIREGLLVLFVGYNPSLRSGETGHHYANPSNRFWRALLLSGLTPRLYKPEEGAAMLELGFGFTNIVARPTRAADEITKREYEEGRIELERKIIRYRPKSVCFVGKGVYEQYAGIPGSRIDWGKQQEPVSEGKIEYVVPSTSGLVRMSLEEIAGWFQGLKELIADKKGT